MGGGSVIKQYERRFGQGESVYEKESTIHDVECEKYEAKTIRVFGEYEIRKTEREEYELLKKGELIGKFSKAIIEEDRFLFPLSRGILLEVSEEGRKEIATPKKAEICGLIASDGGLYSTREHSDHEVHFTSKNRELIERYNDLFKEVYGIEPHVYHKRKRDGREYFESRTYDRGVYFDLLDLGIKPKAFEFHVPFKHLDKDGLRAYLRGFFSGDGNISKSEEGFSIKISSTCEEGIKELRKAFELLGFHPNPIHVSKREPPLHDYYVFSIPEDEYVRFAEEIGTYHPGRAKRLESIRLKYKSEEEEREVKGDC